MNLRETYYMKFNSEIERFDFKNKIVASPYYLGHYMYEREASGVDSPIQYMLCIDIGNFVPTSKTPVFGEHTPVPIFDTEEGEAADDESSY